MTTIQFTDEHLRILMKALEVYSRLRAGQIGIAMDEAFRDFGLSWDEREYMEIFMRNILFPKAPELQYDGHGGYYDQFGRTYDENGTMDESQMTWDDEQRLKRFYEFGTGNFGVGHEKMNKSGGTLAYEIYSTLRQYDALRRNDGYEGNTVDFHAPLELTGTPLPKIEGFSAEKTFPIKGKAVLSKIKKAKESQDYGKMWEIVGDYLAWHYPELEGYSQARIEEEGNHLVVITKGARRKKNEN